MPKASWSPAMTVAIAVIHKVAASSSPTTINDVRPSARWDS